MKTAMQGEASFSSERVVCATLNAFAGDLEIQNEFEPRSLSPGEKK